PMQHETIPQDVADLRVRVEHRAKEAAVRATQFVSQVAEQSQREDRLPGFAGGFLRLFEVCVPVETRDEIVLLLADEVEGVRDSLPFGRVADLRIRDANVDVRGIL